MFSSEVCRNIGRKCKYTGKVIPVVNQDITPFFQKSEHWMEVNVVSSMAPVALPTG